MGIKKKTSLRKAFWSFLLWLLTGLFASVAIPFFLLFFSANLGLVTFADQCEQQTKALVPVLTAAPDITNIRLPAGTRYLRLDKSYAPIDTNMNEAEYERAMAFATGGPLAFNGNTQFILVTRDAEYLVLQYYIGSQFVDPRLNEHLPSPEILTIGAMILNCLGVCIFLTSHFARRLGRELAPLFSATREIELQNLDFEIEHSKIAEFENVLLSFEHMKTSLKHSLEQQWRAEQAQREQIAALAHDLKTPLTVIQGNLDLLEETTLDAEQQLYTAYALESSEQMKAYIKLLIEISKAAMGYQLQKTEIDFPAFWEHILSQTAVLCKEKHLQLKNLQTDIPDTLQGDVLLLERAVMNLIANATEYAPADTTLYLSARRVQGCLEISVTDCGCGFSREALLHGPDRFYMEDESRRSRLHFGMGLYIVRMIAEQHQGQVVLQNSLRTGGAQVVLIIPC